MIRAAHAVGHAGDRGDVSRGATTGALFGGAGGLLAGLGLLAIPVLGPVVAAGWLLATATGAGIGAAGGAATGGIIGALKNSGHTDEEARVYSEGVRRGSTLVSAKIPDAMAASAVNMFGRYQRARYGDPRIGLSGWRLIGVRRQGTGVLGGREGCRAVTL